MPSFLPSVLSHAPPVYDDLKIVRNDAGVHRIPPAAVSVAVGHGIDLVRLHLAAQDGPATLGRLGLPVRAGEGVDGQQLCVRRVGVDGIEGRGVDRGAGVVLPDREMPVPRLRNDEVPVVGQIVVGDRLEPVRSVDLIAVPVDFPVGLLCAVREELGGLGYLQCAVAVDVGGLQIQILENLCGYAVSLLRTMFASSGAL